MAPSQIGPVAEEAARLFDEIVVEVDLAGRERVVIGRRPRPSGS
jgi:hypothetical protein